MKYKIHIIYLIIIALLVTFFSVYANIQLGYVNEQKMETDMQTQLTNAAQMDAERQAEMALAAAAMAHKAQNDAKRLESELQKCKNR